MELIVMDFPHCAPWCLSTSTSALDFPPIWSVDDQLLSSAFKVKLIHKSRFFLMRRCLEFLWAAALRFLFFLCDRKMRMFCLLEYLFIVRKWKKGARGQVHSPGKEKKQGKQPDFLWSIQLDRRGKWMYRMVSLFTVFTWKERILGRISRSFL